MNQSTGLNIIKLLTGKVAILALSFLLMPVITRLFLPAHFGVIQIFDSIAKIVIVISCLKYELSIPLGRDKQEAITGVVICGLIVLLFSGLAFIVVAIGGDRIAAWFHTPQLEPFLWLLPIVIFAGGIGNTLTAWASRVGQFGAMAWSDVAQNLSERGGADFLGFWCWWFRFRLVCGSSSQCHYSPQRFMYLYRKKTLC